MFVKSRQKLWFLKIGKILIWMTNINHTWVSTCMKSQKKTCIGMLLITYQDFNSEVPYAHILLMLPKSRIPTWECLFTNWENWEGKRWRNHLSATAAPVAVLCNGFKNWRPLMKPKKRSKRSLLGLSYNTCQGKD